MAKQIQKTKQTPEPKKTEEERVETVVDEEEAQRLKDNLDELLESIDEALGENLHFSAEFVAAFQQRGGE